MARGHDKIHTAVMTACALAPRCKEEAVEGSSFCAKHRAKTGQAAFNAAQRVGPRRPSTPTRYANPTLTCLHCGQAGGVAERRVTVKKGISGGKATGAIMTAGLSLFATGLSRKQEVRERRCSNCGTTWHVE
jgi:hypothetical protein